MNLLIAVLAAVGYAGGSALQGAAVRHRAAPRALRYGAGLVLDGTAWVLSLVALHTLPVYVVQAVLASSVAFTVVFARIWQQATVRARDVAAVGALIAALAVIAVAGQEQRAPVVDAATTAYLTAFGLGAVVAVTVVLAVGRRTTGRASLPALLAGLSFAATALAARAVRIRAPLWRNLHQPLVWVIVATAIAGTVGYTAALERGSVGPVTAQLWAVEVVVPAAVAIPLLGDTVRAGWLPAATCAVAAVVAVTAVLARTPPARTPPARTPSVQPFPPPGAVRPGETTAPPGRPVPAPASWRAPPCGR